MQLVVENKDIIKTPDADLQILVVTGYSGAGKSTVLRALEDIGFFCIDNLPIQLLGSLFQLVLQSNQIGRKLALGLDVRTIHNMEYLVHELNKVNEGRSNPIKIFFLTSSSEVLVKRFQETRRKHPLADTISLIDAISYERNLLRPLIELSDLVLDTDQLTIHQLRNFVKNAFANNSQPQLMLTIISFGFKYGLPIESNFVYDVRSLPNPYFVPELRLLDGTDPNVRTYLFEQTIVQEYWHKLMDFIQFSVQKSFDDGRFFMNIAIGCTGGRHRSVAFAHELSQQKIKDVQVLVKHRDIAQDNYLNI